MKGRTIIAASAAATLAMGGLGVSPAGASSSGYYDNPWCSTDYFASFTPAGTSGPTPAVATTFDYTCATTVQVKVTFSDGTSTYGVGSSTAHVYKSSKTPSYSQHRVCNSSTCSDWITLK